MKNKVLLKTDCPGTGIKAIVETDGRGVWFYLHGEEESFGIKSCWVRNLKPAPTELDVAGMQEGIPPLLPADACAHPEGAPRLLTKPLRVLWLEEGDGAALYENDSLLALIPGWSGQRGFNGYARDCIAESELCWPLEPALEHWSGELERAQSFWKSWDKNPWPAYQKKMCGAVKKTFGAESNYYAIDGDWWPPRAMLRIPWKDSEILITVGMSLRPQPTVAQYTENPEQLRRVELAFAVEKSLFNANEIFAMGGYLSAQSALPWNALTWLGHGHTVGCDAIPAGKNKTPFGAILLLRSGLDIPDFNFPPYREDPINLLWMVPITDREREFAQDFGSTKLIEKLAEQKTSFVHHNRTAAVL